MLSNIRHKLEEIYSFRPKGSSFGVIDRETGYFVSVFISNSDFLRLQKLRDKTPYDIWLKRIVKELKRKQRGFCQVHDEDSYITYNATTQEMEYIFSLIGQ